MTLFDVLFGLALVGAVLLVMWAYTLTERGKTFSRDIIEAKKRTGMWISPKLILRHWPAFILMIATVLGMGGVATTL